MAELSIGEKVRQLRGERGLRAFAKAIGYSKSYVAMVESGASRPSDRFLQAVATAEGLPTLQLLPDGERRRKTRPRLRGRIKVIRKRFGRRKRLPTPGGRMEHIFAEVRWRDEGAALVHALDSLRRPPPFWSATRTIARGLTAPEQAAWLQLLLPDGELQELHPHEVRFPFPVVEAPGTVHFAVVIERGPILITAHAQVVFLPRADRVRRLDMLLSAACDGIVTPGNVEIDGPMHKSTLRADRARQSEIALPFLRFRANDVYCSDFRRKVLDWICGLLQEECAKRGRPLSWP